MRESYLRGVDLASLSILSVWAQVSATVARLGCLSIVFLTGVRLALLTSRIWLPSVHRTYG